MSASVSNQDPDLMQPYLLEQLPMKNTYPDVPLEHHYEQIRLMRLLPAEPTAPISCEIFKVTLANLEHAGGHTEGVPCNTGSAVTGYEAVSYVWGSFSDKVVTLNGNEGYSITDNLDAALRRLRNPKVPRILWIDAICIDQNNLAERNAQVGIMRGVFARASRVIVWLGEPPPGAVPSLAYSALGMVFSLVLHGDLAWWRRTWTVQEAAVAREISVRYGEVELTISIFVKIFSDIPDELLSGRKNVTYAASPGPSLGAYKGPDDMEEALAIAQSSVSAIKHLQGDGVPNRGLRDWLLMTDKRYATDPRDKIFGILGLVAQPPLGQGLALAPDYSKPIGDVYTEALCSIAQQQRSLDILTDGWPYNVGSYPWTPDFSATRTKRGDSFHQKRHGKARALLANYGPPVFQASAKSEPEITVLSSGARAACLNASTQAEKPSRSVLSIGGFAIGKICAVSECLIAVSEGRLMTPRRYKAEFTGMVEALTTMWKTSNAEWTRSVGSSTLMSRLSQVQHDDWRALRALFGRVFVPYKLAVSFKTFSEARVQMLLQIESQQDVRNRTAVDSAAATGDVSPPRTIMHQLSDTHSLRLDLGEPQGESCILVATPKGGPKVGNVGYHPSLTPQRVNLDACFGNLRGHFDPCGRSWVPGSTSIKLEGGSVLSATLHWRLCTGMTKSRKATIDLNTIFKPNCYSDAKPLPWVDEETRALWEDILASFGHGCVQQPDLTNPLPESDRMREPHGSSHHSLSCEPHLPDHGKAIICGSDCVDWNMILQMRHSLEQEFAASPPEAATHPRISSHLESLVMQIGPTVASMLDWAFTILDTGSEHLAAKNTAKNTANAARNVLQYIRNRPGFSNMIPPGYPDNIYRINYDHECRSLRMALDVLATAADSTSEDFGGYTTVERFEMAEDFDHLFANRKPFCTTTGLLGFGPMDTQVGDEVAVALGAKTPFVLRTHGQFTHLVGDAYVDGLMDGEMVELHKQYPEEYPLVDLVQAPARRTVIPA